MVKELSVEVQAKLKKIATKMKVPFKEVSEIYETKVKELKESKTTGNVERIALNMTMSEYRRLVNKQMRKDTFTPKSTAEAIYGILVGGLGFRDLAQEMRKKAKDYAKKNGLEAAKDKQLIDGDNNVLDTRETIFGKENPDYLEPLNPKLKLCKNTLIGLFKKNGSKTFKYTTLSTNDNQLAIAWNKIKEFTPCQTFGIVKDEVDLTMKINSSKAETTTTVFKALKEDWDIKELVLTATKPLLTPIDKVEKKHEDTKNAWDRFIIVRGVVNWINLDKPTPWGSIWMGIMDAESGLEDAAQVRCMIPDRVSVDFGEGSEVIVFGRTNRSKYRDNDTDKLEEGDVRIDVYGIYAIPGLTTSKESTEEVEDETEIEGWLN